VNEGGDEEAFRIGQDMTLPAFCFLVGIIPRRSATFRGFHALAVDHADRRLGLSPGPLPGGEQQGVVDRLQQTLVTPAVEIFLHRGERRKVLRQKAPLAARRDDVQKRVHDLAQIRLARAAEGDE